MEFTKIDPFAFDRLPNGKRAQFLETYHLLEERSRHLMEQNALLKHDIDTFQSNLAASGIQGYPIGITAHVCECVPLCPAIWSMLPLELLQLVFARLPLPNIIRLRVLSKTWDRYVTGVTPRFTKLCAEQNPSMFAMINKGSKFDGGNGPMFVKLYDSKQARWHQFVHETCVFQTCNTMSAGDGGLVCLVSTARHKDVNIVVFNPLTRQWRELPPPPSSLLTRCQPCMVQLVMDRDNSKRYKVLVMGRGGRCERIMIFSSATGKWRKANRFSDLIFGYEHSWRTDGTSMAFMPQKFFACAYDCARSSFLYFRSYPSHKFEEDSVLVKGRLFDFHKVRGGPGYLLEEYQVQPHYVPWKQHECHELDELYLTHDVKTRLFGCQNFLLVSAYVECYHTDEFIEYYHTDEFVEYYHTDEFVTRHKRALLFDLSTNQWQEIPKVPECCPTEPAGDMFELRWDAVP